MGCNQSKTQATVSSRSLSREASPVAVKDVPAKQQEQQPQQQPQQHPKHVKFATLPSSSAPTSLSDALDLASLRQRLQSDGDIAKTVVRIEASLGTPIHKVYSGVDDGPILGSGASGIVRLCVHRATGTEYAVKCLDLGAVESEAQLQALRNEIAIMCQLDHPFIVRITEVYESANEIYIVQELCRGGDLFDRLDEQQDQNDNVDTDTPYCYTEGQCARLVQQMLMAIGYLHKQGVVHRDLKLENFLFSTTAVDSDLKLIDFGLSKHFELGQCHHEIVGTPYTVAPEIIKGSYNEKCDVWALGVIAFLLLCGEAPFGGIHAGDNLQHVRSRIECAKVVFEPAEIWNNVSDEAKAFVKRLLEADQDKRPKVRDVVDDPWLQMWSQREKTNGTKASGGLLKARTVQNLIRFKEKTDVQKLLSEVLSFALQPDQVIDLRKEFEALDTDKDGEISLQVVRQVLMEHAEAGQLGSMTEEEIEDIFDAMKTRKNEITIRWHEFLAAAVTLSHVDERSLRLAFDRLDSNRRGFLSFQDLEDLLGVESTPTALRQEWSDSLKHCIGTCKDDRITFQDFKRILKCGPRVDSMFPEPLDSIRRAQSLFVFDGNNSQPRPGMSFSERGLTSRALLAAQAAAGEAGSEDFRTDGASPIMTNRALYRRLRAMRRSVMDASKNFDRQRSRRLADAGLIMQRGVQTPLEWEDENTRQLFTAASKRCGRGQRFKTKSDITGMLAAYSAQ